VVVVPVCGVGVGVLSAQRGSHRAGHEFAALAPREGTLSLLPRAKPWRQYCLLELLVDRRIRWLSNVTQIARGHNRVTCLSL
jgi:hypothetical protein